jgi:hypothetical protein
MRSVYLASATGLAATLLFWMCTTKGSEPPGLSDDEALALCHASDPVTRALDKRVRERQAFDAYREHVAAAVWEHALGAP